MLRVTHLGGGGVYFYDYVGKNGHPYLPKILKEILDCFPNSSGVLHRSRMLQALYGIYVYIQHWQMYCTKLLYTFVLFLMALLSFTSLIFGVFLIPIYVGCVDLSFSSVEEFR
jgi:hypothetical protein